MGAEGARVRASPGEEGGSVGSRQSSLLAEMADSGARFVVMGKLRGVGALGEVRVGAGPGREDWTCEDMKADRLEGGPGADIMTGLWEETMKELD